MTTTFESLGLSTDLVDALSAAGITHPFPIQSLTIPDALAGRDVCGKAKTGSGKTLAFGLPLLERTPAAQPNAPTALVLVPTRELAVQVHQVLQPLGQQRGVRVAVVYGGQSLEKQSRKISDGAEIVVATPGRLIDLLDRKAITLEALTCVVLDEADRMADMGFLPQVEWILRHVGGPHQTLLFSATLDGAVDVLVKRYQTDPVHCEVESRTITVDEMVHRFLLVHEMDKAKVAAAISRGVTRTMMFTRTKRGADKLAQALNREGVDAAAIHGDLPQKLRERALDNFQQGKLPVLVATDVAARGLHIDDVDVVIHYDPPSDHKTYLHRSGRTARAGESGVVVTLVLWNEELEIKRLLPRIGVQQPLVEVFSNDPRLADLVAWDPATDVAS
ncbi:MAG TPA: DEAD/DEAH box helicase [Acidimicrobiales bacterium]|nr:DEAD/DEAH box helicase [Acidimicrobiales bacterium]